MFEYLDSPTDLKNVTSASLIFEEYLHPRKPSFLFADVLEVLVEFKYMSDARDILSCRLVNTFSKKSTDYALSLITPEHFKRFPERDFVATLKAAQRNDCEQDFEKRGCCLTVRLFNHKPDKLQQVIDSLRKLDMRVRYVLKDASPFPSRHLFLQERPHTRSPPTLDSVFQRQKLVRNFLDIAGSYFWHCDMFTHSHGLLTLTTWYLGIVEYIRRLPNLKSLMLHYPLASHGYANMDVNQLGEVIRLHPFPTLKHLQMLIINDVPDCVIKAVLLSNYKCPAIQLLSGTPSLMVKCKTLESFSLLVTSPNEVFTCFRSKRWPILRHLQIDFTLQGSSLSWQNLFNFLERYQDTLTHLQVEMPWSGIAPSGASALLRLPRVVELRLTLHTFAGIDFILGLSSLKKLHVHLICARHMIRVTYGRPLHFVEKILFNKHFDRMLESNIWQLMPTLEQVNVTVLRVGVGVPPEEDGQFVTYRYLRRQIKAKEEKEPLTSATEEKGGNETSDDAEVVPMLLGTPE